MIKITQISALLYLLIPFSPAQDTIEHSPHDLVFTELATTWDEGIPLGNGMMGALIWKKEGNLRISLDRADL